MHVNNKKIERNSSRTYQHMTYIERTKRKGKEVYFYGVLQSSKEEKWRTMFTQTFWEELSYIWSNPRKRWMKKILLYVHSIGTKMKARWSHFDKNTFSLGLDKFCS